MPKQPNKTTATEKKFTTGTAADGPVPEVGCYHCGGTLQHDQRSGAYVCFNDRAVNIPGVVISPCPRYGLLSVVTNRSRK